MAREVALIVVALMIVAGGSPSYATRHDYRKLSVNGDQKALWQSQAEDAQAAPWNPLSPGDPLELQDTLLGEIAVFRARLSSETEETDIKKATFSILTANKRRTITVEKVDDEFVWTIGIDEDLDGVVDSTPQITSCWPCAGDGIPPEFTGPIEDGTITVWTTEDEEAAAEYILMQGEDPQ